MKSTLVRAFGRRFVHVSCEASPRLLPDAAFRELMERCNHELGAVAGLSLEDTVRTRLWGRTAYDRDVASTQRRESLSGRARSSSSSYIAPGHFESAAGVAVDLIALEPARRRREKTVVEYDPAIAPPRYVIYDGMVFLSGVTYVVPTLEEAVASTMAAIGQSLKHAGASWRNVVKISNHLRRDYSFEHMEKLLRAAAPVKSISTDYAHVDGYSSPGKHVEIEVTARLI